MVVISHAADEGMPPAWLGDGFGKIGVMVFFLLSSYLMATIYLQMDVMQGRMPLLGLVLVLEVKAGLASLSFYGFEPPAARMIRRLQRRAALRKA